MFARDLRLRMVPRESPLRHSTLRSLGAGGWRTPPSKVLRSVIVGFESAPQTWLACSGGERR